MPVGLVVFLGVLCWCRFSVCNVCVSPLYSEKDAFAACCKKNETKHKD